MAWKRVVRPSVWLSFSLGNGGGLHGNDEVSDVYLVWKPGPRVARPDLGECFVGRNRVGVFVWMRRLDYCNWSALLKQSLSRFFSVCLCKVCVWVCFCACVCVRCVCGVLFVSRVFSQRRFTEYVLPPLATLPTTSLHHTTLVLICIRFTCPRCYSEGQEDRLVVPHADIGPNVIIDYRLLFIFRL